MENITGKITKIIYQNEENNYTVALFKPTEEFKDIKSLRIVGYFYDIKLYVQVSITGEFTFNEKYSSSQFDVNSYEYILPTTKEKIIDFLGSSFITGCGKKTAEKLYELYKEDTLNAIKDITNILKVDGINEKKANQIHSSMIKYDGQKDLIEKLTKTGFLIEDISKIINKYKDKTEHIIESDFYALKEIIDFNKLDNIYLKTKCKDDKNRLYHLILEVMKYISFSEGHIYYSNNIIIKYLESLYNISLNIESYEEIINILLEDNEIIIESDKIYLKEYYEAEETIAYKLKSLLSNEIPKIEDFDNKINNLESMLNITYDDVQKKAIKTALNSNVSIISGGPGTGKTTILNAIIKLYVSENKLRPIDVISNIALVAPTGRASKKMSSATTYSAYTIHRYLKWFKENDTFTYNEYNQTCQKLVVIDEASMIDLKLFSALLSALKDDAQIILVGDEFQLPSVGAGQVLNNLIKSELFNFINLTKIYRQSDNSFIPYLAKQIKDVELDEEILSKKDDYNFIMCDNTNLRNMIKMVTLNAKEKAINEDNMQILVPMYKGDNGIDSLNLLLRDIYNPRDYEKKEILFNDITYREKDKVIQLSNDPDNNIFNGDIGYISNIDNSVKGNITIDFEDTIVHIDKKSLKNIKHAYAISIHKSQGSEFDHVIIPIVKDYFVMMYNKLLYTGVSRAKKSLILLGDPQIFSKGVRNNKADTRNSSLTEKLISIICN